MSNTTSVAPKAPSKIETLKKMISSPSVQEQFENALKDNSGIFVASLIDLFNGDTYLQNCEPKQVIMEALKAATLKLPLNKSLGFAYVVPYKKRQKVGDQWHEATLAQFQIGYKGLIQLAMRTGQYRIINADVVYEGEYQSHNKLTGEFNLNGQAKSDNVVGYFAHIEMLNGFSKTLYMTRDRVTAHAKKYSKSFNNSNSPWQTEFDAMAIKTVLRNLLGHYGFLSVEMVSAFDNDNDQDVADRVQDDVNKNANKENIGFTNAEVIESEVVNEEDPGY